MKVLLIPLLACSIASAQAVARQPAQQQQPAAAQPQTAQSPELAEAERLSAKVFELYSAGRFEEALPLAERVLAIREKLLGPSAAPVADALANLGVLQRATRKNDRARASYERALSIYEATLGPEAPTTVNARNALAWHYYWTRNYDRAEPAFRRAHEARERALGATHRLTADSLSGLAAVHLAKGDESRRDETFLRLLDAVERMPGDLPKMSIRLLQAYGCTGARSQRATDRQKEVEGRIAELWKKRSAEGGAQVEGTINGKAISKPAPAYPAEAKLNGVSGTVVVHITVDETGRVTEAEAICGPPPLYEASERAARMARFTPTLRGGQPIRVTGTITYNYNLSYSGPPTRP